jgi:hypothetical protein
MYTPPDDVVYGLSDWPKQVEIDDYLQRWAVAGFDEGAVVCRRYQQENRWKYPHQWGVIMIRYEQQPANAPYRPFSVKWFGDLSIEQAMAEDLFIIHAALDESVLKDIIEEQGGDV